MAACNKLECIPEGLCRYITERKKELLVHTQLLIFGGLMVSTLDSGLSSLGFNPGRGHYVVFLGKTLNSHIVSLHPGYQQIVKGFTCDGLASHPGE